MLHINIARLPQAGGNFDAEREIVFGPHPHIRKSMLRCGPNTMTKLCAKFTRTGQPCVSPTPYTDTAACSHTARGDRGGPHPRCSASLLPQAHPRPPSPREAPPHVPCSDTSVFPAIILPLWVYMCQYNITTKVIIETTCVSQKYGKHFAASGAWEARPENRRVSRSFLSCLFYPCVLVRFPLYIPMKTIFSSVGSSLISLVMVLPLPRPLSRILPLGSNSTSLTLAASPSSA